MTRMWRIQRIVPGARTHVGTRPILFWSRHPPAIAPKRKLRRNPHDPRHPRSHNVCVAGPRQFKESEKNAVSPVNQAAQDPVSNS
jgi:hypothetical protein